MPKKTKEDKKIDTQKIKSKNTTSKSKNTTTKANNNKKTSSVSKASVKDKTLTTKKATSKTAKKTTTTKSTKTKASTSKKKQEKPTIIEYYDLPQKYNQTIVKVLVQTPKTLFIYWEISDEDVENYKNQYGEDFFQVTKPILIVHNDTLNYSFEVEINDFANSWYLHVNDSKSNYRIELGRRPITLNKNISTDYIYIASSNTIESPNDHILFNNSQKMVYFRNVKNNREFKKNISTLTFIRNMGKIYDIYDLYKELYKNKDNIDNLSNPSSNTSSKFI